MRRIVRQRFGVDSRGLAAATMQRIPQGVIERLPSYLNVLLHLREDGLSDGLLGAALRDGRSQRRADPARPRVLRPVRQARASATTSSCSPIASSASSAPTTCSASRSSARATSARRSPSTTGCGRAASWSPALFDSDPRKVGSQGRRPDRARHRRARARRRASSRSASASSPCRPRARKHVADLLCAAGIRVIVNYSTAFVNVPGERDAAQHRSRARTAPHAVLPVARRRRSGRIESGGTLLASVHSVDRYRPFPRVHGGTRMISTPVFAIALPFLGGIGAPELHHHPGHRADPLRPEAPAAARQVAWQDLASPSSDGIEGKLDEGRGRGRVEARRAKKAEPATADAKKPTSRPPTSCRRRR